MAESKDNSNKPQTPLNVSSEPKVEKNKKPEAKKTRLKFKKRRHDRD